MYKSYQPSAVSVISSMAIHLYKKVNSPPFFLIPGNNIHIVTLKPQLLEGEAYLKQTEAEGSAGFTFGPGR